MKTIIPTVSSNGVVSYDLRPITTMVEQAIESFSLRSGIYVENGTGKLFATLRIKGTKASPATSPIPPKSQQRKSVEITIVMFLVDPPPDGGTPSHPPKEKIVK